MRAADRLRGLTRTSWVWMLTLSIAACQAEDPPVADPVDGTAAAPAPAAVAELIGEDQSSGTAGGGATPLPVDSAVAPAVAGVDGWEYFLSRETDLDADGAPERVVVMARAALIDGRPAWDDGQSWQVYVEEADGERTYLYRRFVQLGTVTMRIGLNEEEQPANVILIEHLPDRLALYELDYRGPGEVEVIMHYERRVDPYGELASPQLPG